MEYYEFVYAVSATFLLPVSSYALVGRLSRPFMQTIEPNIVSLDHYGLV